MSGTDTNFLQRAGWPVLIGLAYFVLAQVALHLTRGELGIAAIWPSSGVLLAGLMLNRRAQRKWILLTCAIASILANHTGGTSWLLASGFTLANVAEATVALWLIGKAGRSDGAFYDPRIVARFAVGSVCAGLVSSTFAMLLSGDWSYSFFQSWATTVTLGLLIITPLIVTVTQTYREQRRSLKPAEALFAGLIFSLVALVTTQVFQQNTYPLLFLPLVTVMLATYRLGPLGAAVSVCLIVIIGSVCTFTGSGPIDGFSGSREAGVLFFQFFLLVNLASALPLAALLAQRDRNFATLARSKRFLEMAEQTANVGHWHFDLRKNVMFWSDETYRIYGREKTCPLSVERAVAMFVKEDRAMVREVIERSARKHEGFAFQARIRRPDGMVRHVESRGEPEFGRDGSAIALFGMIQDVTERIEAIAQIEQSRREAQEEARISAILADTDQLTGIANRRKAMATLRSAIARAEAFGSDLTIAILDVDHFKRINDTYGHAAGDAVLVRLTQQCTKALRDRDLLGRMGGEEFVAILPGASASTGYEIGERLRLAVAGTEWSDHGPQHVTVSIGIATFRHTMDENALLQAADRALYQAKNDGRNLLRVAA